MNNAIENERSEILTKINKQTEQQIKFQVSLTKVEAFEAIFIADNSLRE